MTSRSPWCRRASASCSTPSLIWLPFGVLILADHMLPPRKGGVMIPGPQVHAMKVAFEKYYLWKSRHGYVRLP